MPHIFLKNFNVEKFKTETSFEEVTFSLLGENIRKENHYLLFSKFREKSFFLKIQKRKEKWIIKSEKSSRPSPNFPVHKSIYGISQILGEIPISSNLNLKESEHLRNPKLLEISEFEKIWNRVEKIAIEIGFGSGRHLLFRAEENRDKIFIGIEIHKPSLEQALKQIKIRNLENIYILDFDARHFLETVPSNRISEIYVHFPVPWDKAPKRRIIGEKFLEEAKRVLEVDGILELRTDSENYFKYSLGLFLKEQFLEMELFKNRDIEVESKYEARWLKQEKNIYNFRLRNLKSGDEVSNSKISKTYFRTRDSLSKIPELLGKKVLKDDWFVSFQDIYLLSENSYILHIVAGSYEYPETIFLFIDLNKIEYLIKTPLEIEVNLTIDKYLRELL